MAAPTTTYAGTGSCIIEVEINGRKELAARLCKFSEATQQRLQRISSEAWSQIEVVLARPLLARQLVALSAVMDMLRRQSNSKGGEGIIAVEDALTEEEEQNALRILRALRIKTHELTEAVMDAVVYAQNEKGWNYARAFFVDGLKPNRRSLPRGRARSGRHPAPAPDIARGGSRPGEAVADPAVPDPQQPQEFEVVDEMEETASKDETQVHEEVRDDAA